MLILRPFHAPRKDKIALRQNVVADSGGEGVRSDVTGCVQTQRSGDGWQWSRQPVSTSLCGLSSRRFVEHIVQGRPGTSSGQSASGEA